MVGSKSTTLPQSGSVCCDVNIILDLECQDIRILSIFSSVNKTFCLSRLFVKEATLHVGYVLENHVPYLSQMDSPNLHKYGAIMQVISHTITE